MSLQVDREARLRELMKANPGGLSTDDLVAEFGLTRPVMKVVLSNARRSGVVRRVHYERVWLWVAPENADAVLAKLIDERQAPEDKEADEDEPSIQLVVPVNGTSIPRTRGVRSVFDLSATLIGPAPMSRRN